MAISDDFTIDYVNQRCAHVSGQTVIYTVNALYSYLQDTFDELAQMDDTIPMSAQTPTEYTLINGWYMDDDSFQFLKGGAVKSSGWLHPTNTTGVRILTLASISGVTSADIGKAVAGVTTGDTGKLLAFNTTDKKLWVRTDAADDLFDNASENINVDGTLAGAMSAVSVSGENLWPNVYTLGTIEQHVNEEQIYIAQNSARIFSGSEWWPEDKTNSAVRHIDVLIKTKEAGTEIDSGNITVFLRNYPSGGNADLYDHFGIDLTAGGRNAVPLATSVDLNNTSQQSTVSGYNDISIAFVNGTITYSAVNGAFTDFTTITGASSGATGVFLKQTTTTGAGTMTLGNVVGIFENPEALTGAPSKSATSSSTLTKTYTMTKAFEQGTNKNYSVVIGCATRVLSQLYEYLKYVTRIGSTFTMYPTTYPQGGPLALNTQQGQLYIRAHEDTQTTPTNTFSPVKASPFGTFAGGKFFGAQGVWIENMATADIQNFQLIDSDGTTQSPPNKQSVTISNLLSDDRISVFRTTSGTTIDKDMYTAAAGNDTADTTFVVNETIAVDTPAAGSIRVVDTSDLTSTREVRYEYNNWDSSTKTFTLTSGTLGKAYTQTDDTVYVPFIDMTATTTSATVQVIYTTDRTILIRVRRKTATAILPFETTGTFGSTGYSTSAIRTADSIVT